MDAVRTVGDARPADGMEGSYLRDAFIEASFVPLEAHIKEHPAYFHRFEAVWTPTVLILDSDGKERWRLEGYLARQHHLR